MEVTAGRRECEACQQRRDLHAELHNELQLEPWVWPCWEHPSAASPYLKGSPADEEWCPNLEGQSLWQLLEEASKATRRRKQVEERAEG